MTGDSLTPNDAPPNQPCQSRLVGTTGELYAGSIARSNPESPNPVSANTASTIHTNLSPGSSNYFKSLQWSADGTTILTTSADHTLRSFVLPPTLLDPPHPHALTPYTTQTLPEPAYATTLHPSYTLSDPSTCLYLTSLPNLPLRLYSTLGGGILASYPLVSPTTEAYVAPHSLLFSSLNPNEVFAGSDCMIAVFDISRPGEGPLQEMRTGRHRTRGGGSTVEAGGMRGIVSAMAISCDDVLAAGTFSRRLGLYDGHGRGEAIATFSVAEDGERDKAGITQVLWSDDGRYLCVAERASDGIGVWDIRGTGKRLAWLKGRKAMTPQRMGVEVVKGEVWAGGTDGAVRVWEGLGLKEGEVERSWEFEAHRDVVNGVGLHPGGSVLATCSGQKHFPEAASRGEDDVTVEEDSSGSEAGPSPISLSSTSPGSVGSKDGSPVRFDNSLKVWTL